MGRAYVPALRRHFSIRHAVVATAAAAVIIVSCRDGVPPFTPEQRTAGDGQITFGFGQDRDPRWTPDGDTLLYHTDQYGPLPASGGVLLRIPAAGGTALPLFGEVQRRIDLVLGTPVRSPDAQRDAYFDLIMIQPLAACDASLAVPAGADCAHTQPLLDSALLRVRRIDATGLPVADVSLGVRLRGTDPQFRAGGSALYTMQLLPFQQQYRAEQAMLFRPAWAPDNQRIAFSDGLQLYIWRVGDAVATPIPGTADGVSAAWSAQGDRIAFTLLQRRDSTQISCACVRPGTSVVGAHRRMLYSVDAPRIIVVRPDGTGRLDLGPGTDPAWSPDGQFIYAHRDNQIVRITVQSGATQIVPNTTRGRYPAVSPDGRRLAFARAKQQVSVDYDIWVVTLPQ